MEDTGGNVDGHHIDLYMPRQADAKQFGRQRVKVVVLKYGDDEASPPDAQQKAEAKAIDRKVRAQYNPLGKMIAAPRMTQGLAARKGGA